jgi:hypothetical protein
MQLITLTFTNTLNQSMNVGDMAYYVTPQQFGGFQTGNLNNIIEFGTIVNIDHTNGTIDVFMFAADGRVSTSSLAGYFAEIHFVNNSTEKAELFSVGSEVFESSK